MGEYKLKHSGYYTGTFEIQIDKKTYDYKFEAWMDFEKKNLINKLNIYGPHSNNPSRLNSIYPVEQKIATPEEIAETKKNLGEGKGLHSLLSNSSNFTPSREQILEACILTGTKRMKTLIAIHNS